MALRRSFILSVLMVVFLEYSEAARILSLIPVPSKSHGILIERLMGELIRKGHEIVYITATPPTKPIPNLKVIKIPDARKQVLENMPSGAKDTANQSLLDMKNMSPWMSTLYIMKLGPPMCDMALKIPSVQEIVRSDSDHFDLILGEAQLSESLLAGFSHKFQAPIVAVATFMPNIWPNFMVGNPAPSSYIPDPFLEFPSKMNFLQRLENFLFTFMSEICHTFWYLPEQDKVLKKHFGDDVPYVTDIIKNTSIVLVNYHQSLNFPRPYVPNMIEVAGFHIDDPKPLPKELQDFLDKSTKGAIFFSLGSNVDSSELNEQKIAAILKALSQLKQNVIWRFSKNIENLPKNVKIGKWFPQSDILAHPNVKLFITHGGLLSTTESIYRGVPMVGIPLFGDQPINMRNIQNAGLGLSLNFDDISEQSLFQAVTEVLNNPSFYEAVRMKLNLLQDNPMPPLEAAIWWIDYVLRHKGAHHLRSAVQDLAWYQYYLLDVSLFLIVLFSIFFYTLRFILRKIYRLFFAQATVSNKSQNKLKLKGGPAKFAKHFKKE